MTKSEPHNEQIVASLIYVATHSLMNINEDSTLTTQQKIMKARVTARDLFWQLEEYQDD